MEKPVFPCDTCPSRERCMQNSEVCTRWKYWLHAELKYLRRLFDYDPETRKKERKNRV